MIITDITAQRRRPTRVSVSIDDHFWIGLEGTLATELGMRIGLVLDEAQQRDLEERVGKYEALSRAVQFLGARMRTEAEIRRKFSEDYPESIMDAVIEQLVGYGYVDDDAWMEELMRSAGVVGKGRRWVEQKAYQAGVDRTTLQEALRSFDDEGQVEAALEYCHQQRVGLEDTGKLWRRLASRGYSPDIISTVKRELEREGRDE